MLIPAACTTLSSQIWLLAHHIRKVKLSAHQILTILYRTFHRSIFTVIYRPILSSKRHIAYHVTSKRDHKFWSAIESINSRKYILRIQFETWIWDDDLWFWHMQITILHLINSIIFMLRIHLIYMLMNIQNVYINSIS